VVELTRPPPPPGLRAGRAHPAPASSVVDVLNEQTAGHAGVAGDELDDRAHAPSQPPAPFTGQRAHAASMPHSTRSVATSA